ncbi:hypothetical protein [Nostoc sp.]|uniref:hypothetical protein n=1 Tax=Nostoc sp. TaxID=1180 RepID=UPI002FF98535
MSVTASVAAILWVNRQPKLLSNISPTVSSLDPPQHTRRRGTVTLRGNDMTRAMEQLCDRSSEFTTRLETALGKVAAKVI